VRGGDRMEAIFGLLCKIGFSFISSAILDEFKGAMIHSNNQQCQCSLWLHNSRLHNST